MTVDLAGLFRPDLVASDLDGTLLPPDQRLTAATTAAVRRLREAGIPFVICTGRMLRSARRMAGRLGLIQGPMICYQGALVADLASGEWLMHRPLSTPLAVEVIEHVRELGCQVNVYVNDEFYVEVVGEWARGYAEYAEVPVNVVGDLVALVQTPPTKIVIATDPAAVDVLLPKLQGRWRGRLYVTRSLPQYIEVCDLRATKSNALDHLCTELGLRPERCVACGDGLNDVDMLRWAGMGVAMAQAAQVVRDAADVVVSSDDLGELFSRLAALA